MRVQGVVLFIAAFACNEASASSFEALGSSTSTPSIMTLGEQAAIDPSIVAATPAVNGPTPSIVALADTPAGDTPSIVALGEPVPASENAKAAPTASSQRAMDPMVIRGGEVGSASARPGTEPAQAATQSGAPLLDPNDKGTPSKRRALKRQAERLAQEAAEAAASGQSAQPDASTEPVPLGQ